MHYINKYSNNSKKVDAKLKNKNYVININRTLQLCLNRATSLYTCKLYFDIPSVSMFSKTPPEDIIKKILFTLEQHCPHKQALTIKLEQLASSDTAVISFVSDNTTISTIEIELYTGIPGVVITEPYDTGDITELIGSVIECLLKIHTDRD